MTRKPHTNVTVIPENTDTIHDVLEKSGLSYYYNHDQHEHKILMRTPLFSAIWNAYMTFVGVGLAYDTLNRLSSDTLLHGPMLVTVMFVILCFNGLMVYRGFSVASIALQYDARGRTQISLRIDRSLDTELRTLIIDKVSASTTGQVIVSDR